MKPKKKEIFKVFDILSDHHVKQNLHIDTQKVKKILPSIYSPGLSFQYVFNFTTRNFEYVSDTIADLLGVPSEGFKPEDYISRIHPEDFNHFLKCEELAGYFLFKHIEKERIPDYKVSYQLRLKDRNNNYILVLHQAISLALDDNFNLAATLVNNSDISHITTSNNYKISFINIRGGKSYYHIETKEDLDEQTESPQVLSKREIEILGCLSEGLSSQEVAEQLFISPATVRTHRNNILKKTSFQSITQAVAYSIRQGLI